MLRKTLLAVAIFGIWFVNKDSINNWGPTMSFLGNLAGVGLPLVLIFESIIDLIREL